MVSICFVFSVITSLESDEMLLFRFCFWMGITDNYTIKKVNRVYFFIGLMLTLMFNLLPV